MDYKNEYLREKKKYIELRDQVVQEFNQTGGGMFERFINGLFRSNDDNDSEGGAIPQIKEEHEIIFFNADDLKKGTVTFDVIKGRLFGKDKGSRQLLITENEYQISTAELLGDLQGKAYSMKIGDTKATLVQPVTVKLERVSLPAEKPPVREPVKKQLSLPAMKLGMPSEETVKGLDLTPRERKIVDVCYLRFGEMDPAKRETCTNIVGKIVKTKQTGGELVDELNALLGGDAPKALFLKPDTIPLKLDKTLLFNDARRLKLFNEIRRRSGLKVDTVIIIERVPGTNNARIIGLYKDYEY